MTGVIDRKIADKPYDLRFEERKSYLYVRVEGRAAAPSRAADYLREITNQCRKNDCRRVVIEKRVPGRLAVWDIFSVATGFPSLGSELTKIAVVDKNIDRSERKEFSVMVGRESGLDLHVFTDVSEAEDWVVSDRKDH